MSNEDLDEATEADLSEEDVDEDELDDEEVDADAIVGDDDLDDDAEVAVEDIAVVEGADAADTADAEPAAEPVAAKTATKTRKREDDDDALDLDEEMHPDDIEEPLDVLLKERTASGALEEDEEAEEEIEVDERGETPTRIVPRRADEFLCSSCFLVLPRTQLADEKRMLCRDCV
jgi:Domain of unknown function (DUF4193)